MPLLPRLSTTGKASVGPGGRSKVQSSPRLIAGPRVIPVGGERAGSGVSTERLDPGARGVR